jgi:hypothetical protein
MIECAAELRDASMIGASALPIELTSSRQRWQATPAAAKLLRYTPFFAMEKYRALVPVKRDLLKCPIPKAVPWRTVDRLDRWSRLILNP